MLVCLAQPEYLPVLIWAIGVGSVLVLSHDWDLLLVVVIVGLDLGPGDAQGDRGKQADNLRIYKNTLLYIVFTKLLIGEFGIQLKGIL